MILLINKSAPAFPLKKYAVEGDSIKSIALPDWSKISFSSFDTTDSEGNIELGDPEDTVIKWNPGATVESIITLKTISLSLGAQSLTVQKIANLTGINLNKVFLSNFDLATSLSLRELVKIVPTLGHRRVKDVAPIAELLKGKVDETTSLQNVIEGSLGDLILNTIDLSKYKINSIPYLANVPIYKFKNWEIHSIASVALLPQLAWSKFPIPPKFIKGFGVVARIDAIWGTAERERLSTVSGGYSVGFEYPCINTNCAQIELDDLENQGTKIKDSFEGKSWISGKYQKVPGGDGCLATVNNGLEPTGRHPWGDFFKVSVENTNESKDRVTTALYFRVCTFCGCTPYFIGPFPFLNYKINDPIYLGF